jgi:hypothetical protein
MGHDKLFQKKNVLTRREKTRKLRRILIVCEGEKTEPNYFKKFKANPEVFDAIDVQGTGYNTVSLITEAIKIKEAKKEPYIEIWCVFDKDDFSIESFEKAIKLAEQNQIKCAYSIEAFEIWYMLHFNFYDTAFSRLQYKEKLSELLKKPYLKNDPEMYLRLCKKQSIAVQNVRKLYNKQCLLPLKDQNPITTVFQLVERLIG